MPRVVHFEIHADDPERASKFYRTVFGWDIRKWDGPEDYWLVTTGPDDQMGINGGLLKRQEPLKGTGFPAYVCTVGVPSVDEYAAKIEASGGSIAVPKAPIQGFGWVAYAKDTEGNTFGVFEPDEKAG